MLYNKIIDRQLFYTSIGLNYLKNLQQFLYNSPDIPDDKIIMPGVYDGRSQEYWTGWILAYYQWYTGKSFRIIQKEVPIERIRDMYNPYHEMDISSAILKLREMSQVAKGVVL